MVYRLGRLFQDLLSLLRYFSIWVFRTSVDFTLGNLVGILKQTPFYFLRDIPGFVTRRRYTRGIFHYFN